MVGKCTRMKVVVKFSLVYEIGEESVNRRRKAIQIGDGEGMLRIGLIGKHDLDDGFVIGTRGCVRAKQLVVVGYAVVVVVSSGRKSGETWLERVRRGRQNGTGLGPRTSWGDSWPVA
jgi:hypothetical protein